MYETVPPFVTRTKTRAVLLPTAIRVFVDASIKKRSEQARVTTEFLRRELVRAERDLGGMNRQITDFRREHRGEMPGDQRGLLGKLERLEGMRQALTRQISETDARVHALASKEDESSRLKER